MLFYVKIQLMMDKMGELMEKSSRGEVPSVEKYSTIYCSTDTPGLGYAVFDVESRDQLDGILAQLKPYSEVYEVAHIITLKEFQARMS